MTGNRTPEPACAAIHPRYEAFVLVHGLCGLRPGEAIALRRRDVDLRDGTPVGITTRGTQSHVPDRFPLEGEARRWPLTGRGERARCTIPLPAELVPVLHGHLAEFTASRRDTYLFTTPTGARG